MQSHTAEDALRFLLVCMSDSAFLRIARVLDSHDEEEKVPAKLIKEQFIHKRTALHLLATRHRGEQATTREGARGLPRGRWRHTANTGKYPGQSMRATKHTVKGATNAC